MVSIPSDLALRVLEQPDSSVRVPLRSLPDATVIWSSTPAAAEAAAGCAVAVVPAAAAERAEAHGCADRYGGMGILSNGGAGRAAVVAGQYAKGIGPTPLIGRGQRDWHSDGDLFLEEAVRECVLGTILSIEAPWGGVRPAAVIDAGARPDAYYRDTSKFVYRAAIVVRENVLRPAHFERAPLYKGREDFGGWRDERRVAANIGLAVSVLGLDAFLALYSECWCRWAEQCAYQFVHRVSQAGPSTSNIALDGRLLDFGGARSMPCWGVHVPGAGLTPPGSELADILRFLRSGGLDVLRRLMRGEDEDALLGRIERECLRRYSRTVVVEVLRLVGFRRSAVTRLLGSETRFRQFEAVISDLIGKARAHFSYDLAWPADEWRWTLPEFWSASTPRVLRPLRLLCETFEHGGEPIQDRAEFRTRSRPDLNHDNLHEGIFREFAGSAGDRDYGPRFRRYVAGLIVRNRRDANVEPAFARPSGFVLARYQSFALFTEPYGRLRACGEFARDGTRVPSPVLRDVVHLDEFEIKLQGEPAREVLASELDD